MDYANIDYTSKKEKWTVMKYVADFNLLLEYAELIRRLKFMVDDETIEHINDVMKDIKLYAPRNGKPSIDTTSFKICQIVYSMIAYRSRDNKSIVFSPLGNLLLDNKDETEKVSKIYATMLMHLPFNHPYNKMSDSFNIFPYRLIFKLLLDSKLEYKIYADEMFYLVMWTKDIDENSYNTLVRLISELRTEKPQDKLSKFKLRLPVQDSLANALHETEYLFEQLEGAGIVDHLGCELSDKIGVLVHGGFGRGLIPETLDELSDVDKNKYKPTGKRAYYNDYITLKDDIRNYINELLNECGFDEKPHSLYEELGTDDYILHLYNYYPNLLLKEIGVSSNSRERVDMILQMTNDIKKYSLNKEYGDCYRFEEILANAFNEFVDVEAKSLGKAGNADIECIYLTIKEKFDVEAKSTSNKLSSVNAGRLASHREKIGSKYTIVVTPRYVPSVIVDIKNTNNVILTSNSLSNFLYQTAIKSKTISYKPIYDIIQSNKGRDISSLLNDYVAKEYGVGG